MPAESPQAQLPQFRSSGDNLKALSQAQVLNVDPPVLITGNATVVQVFADDPHVAVRSVQNVGTTAVNLAINTDAGATIAHSVLAGGSVAFDGLGSEKDLSLFRGRVTAYSAGAFQLIAIQAKVPLTTV